MTVSRVENNPTPLEIAFVLAGLLAMYIPTYSVLNNTVWNIVGQGHGPIMLALAGWLAWQRIPAISVLPRKSAPGLAFPFLIMGLLSYIVGHSLDILFIDVGSQIAVISALILFYKGVEGLRVMWFPLFFLIFLLPMPAPLVDAITAPLKSGVSHVAENILYAAGYPIGRSGVTLTIGQYKLLVADACAGINSIFALEAIGVFYMSVMRHQNKMRNIALAVLIVPISFLSNVIRVIALVLVTYYFGDAAGQGFVHDFAGILLFMVATILMIGLDSILGVFMKNRNSGPTAVA